MSAVRTSARQRGQLDAAVLVPAASVAEREPAVRGAAGQRQRLVRELTGVVGHASGC